MSGVYGGFLQHKDQASTQPASKLGRRVPQGIHACVPTVITSPSQQTYHASERLRGSKQSSLIASSRVSSGLGAVRVTTNCRRKHEGVWHRFPARLGSSGERSMRVQCMPDVSRSKQWHRVKRIRARGGGCVRRVSDQAWMGRCLHERYLNPGLLTHDGSSVYR